MWQLRGRIGACTPALRLLMLSEMLSLLAAAVGQLAVAWWIARDVAPPTSAATAC